MTPDTAAALLHEAADIIRRLADPLPINVTLRGADHLDSRPRICVHLDTPDPAGVLRSLGATEATQGQYDMLYAVFGDVTVFATPPRQYSAGGAVTL